MLSLNFNPFPNLESKRLIFRSVEESDVHEVFLLRSNPETMKYIPRPLAKNQNDALEHIQMIRTTIQKNEGINWAVCLKEKKSMIGVAGFYRLSLQNYRGELGYMLLPEYHNQGFVTETIRTLLEYAFHTLQFHSIEAIIDPENIASERVLQKNGFTKEAHIKENEYWDGRFLDTVIYSLLKRNFSTK